MLRIGTIAGSVLVGLAFLVYGQETLPKGNKEVKKTEAMSRAASVRQALAERIEIPEEFRKPGQPIPFRLVLAYVDDKLAARKQPLAVVVDEPSFKEAQEGDPIHIYEAMVVFPPFLRSATVQDILELATKQIPSNDATYLVRNGRVDILTHDRANLRILLDEGIAIQIRELPLKSAIEELGNRTGLTVMIDPRCGAELSRMVSVQSQNDISPRGILSSWADMFDLKLLVDDHRVLLMPRADYLKKLRDQAEESQILLQIQKTQGVDPNGPPPPAPPSRNRGRTKMNPMDA